MDNKIMPVKITGKFGESKERGSVL